MISNGSGAPSWTNQSNITATPASHTHKYAGSESAGGAATSANKLNTDAGSGTQPVYFSGGVPVACTYSLGKSVPSDAKFTDTVYTHPTTAGNKHIPSGGSSGQILKWSANGTAEWSSDIIKYGLILDPVTTESFYFPSKDATLTLSFSDEGHNKANGILGYYFNVSSSGGVYASYTYNSGSVVVKCTQNSNSTESYTIYAIKLRINF